MSNDLIPFDISSYVIVQRVDIYTTQWKGCCEIKVQYLVKLSESKS